MNTRVRIRTIRLMEKIERRPEFAEKIGITVLTEGRKHNEQNDEDFDDTFNSSVRFGPRSDTGANR